LDRPGVECVKIDVPDLRGLEVLLARKIEKSVNDDGDALHRGASGTTAMTFTRPKDSGNCQDRQIVDEATEWLMSPEGQGMRGSP
jgi:hypothetical protein